MIILHILTSWRTLLITTVFLRYSNALCIGYWYGRECENMCQCQEDDCNEDGTCGIGTSCYPDWFGPSCQYKDFVLYNGHGIPSWLSDSNLSTCNPESHSKAISMSFVPAIYFTWLRLEYRQIGNFTIKFNRDTVDCLHKRIYIVGRNETDVSCELPIHVNQISVYGDLVGFLCNIFVSMGRNLALKQPTNQTSNYVMDGRPLESHLAVDGFPGVWFEDCSTTSPFKSAGQMWQMFYRRPVFLYYVALWNRDMSPYSLSAFMMKIYGPNNKIVQSYSAPDVDHDVYYVDMTAKSEPVSRLSVVPGELYYAVNICEIETYGDMACTEGKWGPYCEHNCACEATEFCSPVTGKCSSKCPAGFYGSQCHQNCSSFCDSKACHYATGECFQCYSGFMGSFCDVVCPNGTYGVNCSMPCSDKCLNSECFPKNGSCLSCPDKFYNYDCSMPCSDKCLNSKCLQYNGSCMSCPGTFYNHDCSMSCSDKCLNSKCMQYNGSCLSCPEKFYGSDCLSPCSNQCDEELCYARSGACKTCKIGFYTELCDVPCNSTCEDMTCGRDSGYCDPGCPTGKYGSDCESDCLYNCEVCDSISCLKCSRFLYGDYCLRICPHRCYNGICHIKTGRCLSCLKGFYGNWCEKRCLTKCEDSSCDFKSGECPASGALNIVTAAAIAGLLLIILGYLMLFKMKGILPGQEEPTAREPVSIRNVHKIIRRKSSAFFGTWV